MFQPIFREGSKVRGTVLCLVLLQMTTPFDSMFSQGYLCCKRRVLEFEEFLKIEGCTKGRHVFVPKLQSTQQLVRFCNTLLFGDGR